jgi:D-3-phosphoglycerate dehydrogenase
MKVFVADLVSADTIAALQAKGLDVLYDHAIQGPAFVQAASTFNPQVLVVRSKKVTAEVIAAAPSLELIVRAGAGVDNIDTVEASRRGIYVANCPGKNNIAVAELAIGLMLSVDRKLGDAISSMKAGKWTKGDFANCRGLKGRTLGVVGFGFIGQEVARRALSFGMEVFVYDKNPNRQVIKDLGVSFATDLPHIYAVSDFLSFHVPTTPETKGIIGAQLFSMTKPDVVVINTSRGDLTNEAELLEALEAHPEAWYAADVLQGEPVAKVADFSHPVALHPRVYVTPHIGASTKQAEAAIGEEALRVILKYAGTRQLDAFNCVNLNKKSLGTHTLSVRYNPRPNVVIEVLGVLAASAATVFDLSNTVLLDASSASLSVSFKAENLEALESVQTNVGGIAGVIQAVLIGGV